MRFPPPPDWPHAALSRQVIGPPHRWHVQETGTGPTLLFLHGAGGSSHSFRDLVPLLAGDHHLVLLDLPGHGFTRLGARHRSGIEPMAQDLAVLSEAQGWQPRAVVAHSAGAALALSVAARQGTEAAPILALNAALSNFRGLAGVLFPAMAKALALTPFTADIVARTSATPQRIAALIRGTGSHIPAEGIALYRRLIADRDHVDGTLLMMAQWSLDTLHAGLERNRVRALLLTGERDSAVPPRVSQEAAARMPDASWRSLDGLGHLAHEEAPERIAAEIRAFAGTG